MHHPRHSLLGVLSLVAVVIVVVVTSRDEIWGLLAALLPLLFLRWGQESVPLDSIAEQKQALNDLQRAFQTAFQGMRGLLRFVDPDQPSGWAGAGAVPPRLRHRTASLEPGLRSLHDRRWLTDRVVEDVVEELEETGRHLLVTGRSGTGTGTAVLALFLEAQRRYGEDVTAAESGRLLPLWVSLGGWTPGGPGGFVGYLIEQSAERLPELFAARPDIAPALRGLASGGVEGRRLQLFIDVEPSPDGGPPAPDADTDPTAGTAEVDRVKDILNEVGGWAQVVIAGSENLAGIPDADELGLQTRDPSDPPTPAGVQVRDGRVLAPRSTSLLREFKAELKPDGPDDGPVEWPAGVRDRILERLGFTGDLARTVRWIANRGLFAGAGFAWWLVLQEAERSSDAELVGAMRRLRRRRGWSAASWALGAYVLGLGIIVLSLLGGVLHGYDHPSGGLDDRGHLTGDDVREWVAALGRIRLSGGLRELQVLAGNPLIIATLLGAAVFAVTALMARLGGDLGRDQGRPQWIRLAWPGWRDLREELRGQVRSASSLGVVAVLALAAAMLGWPEALAGVTFAAGVFIVVIWLQWCAEVPDPVGRTPREVIKREKRSSRTAASVLGLALAAGSGLGTWWYAARFAPPTLSQALWICSSVALSVGIARGVLLGGDMMLTLLPWRPQFGIGYAERLCRLEDALRRDADVAGSDRPFPLAVTVLLQRLSGPAPTRQVNALRLFRPVGDLIRIRDVTMLGDWHRQRTVRPDHSGTRGGRVTRWGRAVVAVIWAAGLVAGSSGVFAAAVPRLPCAPDPNPLHRQQRQVWVENGQCVGFVEPRPDTSAAVFGMVKADPRWRELTEGLQQIGRINRDIEALKGDPEVVTVVFFAPLSPSRPGGDVNAIWQLLGTVDALKDLSARTSVHVRMLVANSGGGFVSGRSVAEALVRAIPVADRPGPHPRSQGRRTFDAVVGISQSRYTAKKALEVFQARGRELFVYAASVNGSGMADGFERFRSVSPGLERVAHDLLTRAAQKWGGKPVSIIYDPEDPVFSADLQGELLRAASTLGIAIDPVPYRLKATASDPDRDQVLDSICRAADKRFLFAGRADELRAILSSEDSTCRPHMIAGPGAVSLLAEDADTFDESPAGHGEPDRLEFYSLADGSSGWEAARNSDKATGRAALLAAVGRLKGACQGGLSAQIGVRFPAPGEPDGDASAPGFNDLGPARPTAADECGADDGTAIRFCPLVNRCDDSHAVASAGWVSSTVPRDGLKLRTTPAGDVVVQTLAAQTRLITECQAGPVVEGFRWLKVRMPGQRLGGYVAWYGPGQLNVVLPQGAQPPSCP